MEGQSSVEFAIESIRKAAASEQATKLRQDLDRITLIGPKGYNKGWEDCRARVEETLRKLGNAP